MFDRYYKDHILPKTGAVNILDYKEYFDSLVADGSEVLHFSIGSGLSSSYQNACLAASQVPGVHVIDSKNLSTGSGLLVLEAADRIAAGMAAEDIALRSCRPYPHFPGKLCGGYHRVFARGRPVLGARFLRRESVAHPPRDPRKRRAFGRHGAGQKIPRQAWKRCWSNTRATPFRAYQNIDTRRVFITHCAVDPKSIELVRRTVEELVTFDEVFTTTASCVISSHCGPGTLGVLFLAES